jgi:hypothetical protein
MIFDTILYILCFCERPANRGFQFYLHNRLSGVCTESTLCV